MSGAPDPEGPEGGSVDPSMEDILASIRRILNEDPTRADAEPPPPEAADTSDVLVLDEHMMTPMAEAEPEPHPEPEPPAHQPMALAEAEPPPLESPPPEPPPKGSTLLAPETAQAASDSMSQLASAVAAQRLSLVHRGGPTIEDLVREEIRPLLKTWLDTHLPPLVERLVRAEIERLGVGRN
jgi:uncharacterized protein